MSTILFPVVSSMNIRTVSLWKIEKPALKIFRAVKPIADPAALRQKISIAALLIRDRRFPGACTELERSVWQQAYDRLLVALHMLKQAEQTPRHASYCIKQAEKLFEEARELAASIPLADRPASLSQDWIG